MSIAMRESFGKKLVELGKTNPKLVVLDADVSSSTKSILFGKAYPERFFNCGVAEANMVDVAAGLATCGYHPVVNAFAIFIALKTGDQVRNVLCYNNLNVVLAGAYAGLSDSFDGASHQSITDVAIMRALPNMQVIVPGDARQAEQALEYALSQNGPVYIRLNRNPMPDLPENPDFGNGKVVVLEKGTDVTIAANGITATMALEARKLLAERGIDAEILSVPFVKPFDDDGLAASVAKTGKLVTVEEHNIVGGFASACLEALARKRLSCTFEPIGIRDRFTETGPYDSLLETYGISAKNIVDTVLAMIR